MSNIKQLTDTGEIDTGECEYDIKATTLTRYTDFREYVIVAVLDK